MALMRILSLVLILFSTIESEASSDRFHRVPARANETPKELLERYHLHGYQCNKSKFLLINNLNVNSILSGGEQYYIPVFIYNYDGKSIRSTLGIDNWDQAVRIKQYNDLMLEKQLRRKTIVDSRILWVPYHELNCDDEPKKPVQKLAASTVESNDGGGSRTFPIFGPKHQYVPLKDNSMRGKIFYIVAGHGGPDCGAIGKKGKYDLCEDEYAYDVCLRLARKLLEHGAVPYMIIRDPDDGLRSEKYLDCDYDEYCWGDLKIPRSQRARLHQRSDAINELYEKYKKLGVTEQTVVTVHIDSRSKKQRVDAYFYHHPQSNPGKVLAQKLQKALAAKYAKYRKYGTYKGTVKSRDLHMLREVKPTSVFIELGNIINPLDQQRFVLEKNRQYLADWLFEGLR